MDATLVELARAAEAGETCPPVRLLAGGNIILGWPAPSAQLADQSAVPLATEYAAGMKRRSRREQRDEPMNAQQAAQDATELLRAANDRTQRSDPTALTLIGAQWLSQSDGGGMNLPVIRVPLASVDAWWIAGGDKIDVRGWSGFVGVIAPTA